MYQHGDEFPARVECADGDRGGEVVGVVTEALRAAKAVIVGGTGIADADAFARFAGSVLGPLATSLGEHPRAGGGGAVFSPVEFDPSQKLLWHNENSFDAAPPATIAFCCAVPAAQGGETPVVRGADVFADLPDDLVAEFMARQVRYVRRFLPGVGRSWQDIFGTADRDEVGELCALRDMEFDWQGEVLVTSATRPAAHFDETSGVWSWINQAQHWHPSCSPARDSLRALFGDAPPRDCTFGDGGPISDRQMATILDTYARHERVTPWHAGDVLVVDNLAVAHARNPYTGPRTLFVAMGQPAPIHSPAVAV